MCPDTQEEKQLLFLAGPTDLIRTLGKINIGDRLPRWLSGKESVCNAGDSGSTPGLGRSPGKGNGSPLQYSCLGNPMGRGAWWATQSMGSQRVRHELVTEHHHHYQLVTHMG